MRLEAPPARRLNLIRAQLWRSLAPPRLLSRAHGPIGLLLLELDRLQSYFDQRNRGRFPQLEPEFLESELGLGPLALGLALLPVAFVQLTV